MAIRKYVPKVISAPTHAVIDYVHVGVNVVVGAFFWKRNRKAAAGAFALASCILANALMTDSPRGVFRLYSFKAHGALDYGVAAASSAMPAVLGFKKDPEARYFNLQGPGESAIAAITDYSDDTGATHPREHNRAAEEFLERRMP